MQILFILVSLILSSLANEQPVLREIGSGVFGMQDKTIGGNMTKIGLMSWAPIRVILQTVQGDADIYLSFTTSSVNYTLGSHDLQSTTCGLDSFDVPADTRNVTNYLGIYGHPSHEVSHWRLLLIVGVIDEYSSGMFPYEPEIIYTPNLFDDDREMTFWQSFRQQMRIVYNHITIDVLAQMIANIAAVALGLD